MDGQLHPHVDMTLKVLFVIDGLAAGGAERSLAEMLPGLTRAGITSTVAYFHRHADNLEELFRAQNANLRFVPGRGIARLAALRRLIREERPDVIHTTLFVSDVLGRLASIGQPGLVVTSLVITPYDPIREKNPQVNPAKLWVARCIDVVTARYLTTHFHAVSETVKQAAVETMGLRPERISVIQRGRHAGFTPPTAERRVAARRMLGLKESDEVILNVGRQRYEKGQRYLLEAMETIVRRRPAGILLVAGARGPQTELLERMQRQHELKDRVRILGHRTDVANLLEAADVFAFPSLCEGAAGAIVEAMAAGLPIVGSRIPSIAEVVHEGQNALLVDRGSGAALGDAIVELLADRAKAVAFGKRSREIFEERFTLERCTERMSAFYSSLVEQRDRRLAPTTTSIMGCR
jgi:glycosyltransferase involved in cell wall biosynthesis